MFEIGRRPRIAAPIDWPRIVASRIPVSVSRSAPYFDCRPSNTRFTSPSRPTSSPITNRRGSRTMLAESLADHERGGVTREVGAEVAEQKLAAVEDRRLLRVRRRHHGHLHR